MRRHLPLLLVVCILMGCGQGNQEKPGSNTDRASVTDDAWCDRPGLAAALRQTVLLIDERALNPGTGPDFRQANPVLFDTMMSLGDPARSLPTGAMAPRERISVYLAPADGAPPRLAFSGCLPGLTSEETRAAQTDRSWLGDFAGGDLAKEMEDANAGFRQRFILATGRLGELDQASPVRPGAFANSSLLASLKGVRQLAREGDGAPRIFLYTDLATFPESPDRIAARTAGFAAAREAQISFGAADVFLVASRGTGTETARDFAETFLLGSQANLLGWGGATFNALPAAPVSLKTYAGEIVYPGDRFPARLIIGRDDQNRLVNSWLIIQSDSEWATPVGGSLACANDVCRLSSDRGGLAQRWSPDPDAEPEFTADLPLSGMRDLSAEITPETARGEVSDANIAGFDGASDVRTLPFDLSAL